MPHTGVKHSTLPAAERKRLAENPEQGGFQNSLKIAQLFADIGAQAAEAANRRLLEAAERNIDVGTSQLRLQETDERRKIA